ncbi:ATP-binding protein [Propylenella binzhouense]|nr:ATP-binding protein [Propylenella binzhouense]
MTIDSQTSDRLLTEIERQQKYLDKLPEDFEFPLFNAAQALESQRRSGYRNTAAAAREIVDNAMEAGASRIDVCLAKPKQLKQYQRSESINAIAFIDNGSGMLPKMAQYALSWGSGTHFDDPSFIGKFGFGLPNASINQTRQVEVYTRTKADEPITMAKLDVREVKQHGLQTIGDPVEASLPDFVQAYLDKHGLPFDHGTVVVWVEPDRLTYRTLSTMREHLLDDFGVTYRYLLDRASIYIDGKKVEPVDPLFLTPGARYYLDPDKGGAEQSAEWNIAVKYALDPETGQMVLSRVADEAELDAADPNVVAMGAIYVRVSRFPYGFAEHKDGKAETDAHRRFEIRKSRRGMAFVRAKREIETVDVFPKSLRDQAKGLGDWPLLQSYAYHWGVEVRFEPALDEVFGITNDKQTVRPIEDLWRLFASKEIGIDAQLGREQTFQRKMRKAESDKRKAAEARQADAPTLGEAAAAKADSVAGQRPRVADHGKADAREAFEEEAKRRSKVNKVSIDAARKALEDEAKKRPYVIDFYDEARGPFYKPEWRHGTQVAVLINRQHAFFQTLYGPLLKTPDVGQAKHALDVLLIALARAELTVDDEQASLWYEAQRERHWSSFLNDAYRSLQQTMAPVDEETAEHETAGNPPGEDGDLEKAA